MGLMDKYANKELKETALVKMEALELRPVSMEPAAGGIANALVYRTARTETVGSIQSAPFHAVPAKPTRPATTKAPVNVLFRNVPSSVAQKDKCVSRTIAALQAAAHVSVDSIRCATPAAASVTKEKTATSTASAYPEEYFLKSKCASVIALEIRAGLVARVLRSSVTRKYLLRTFP
jgi:hypothetical protein